MTAILHVVEHRQQLILRNRAPLGKLRLTIPRIFKPAEIPIQKVIQRSREVQHDIAHRIRLLIRPPPHVIVRKRVDSRTNLRGKDFRDPGTKSGESEIVHEGCPFNRATAAV